MVAPMVQVKMDGSVPFNRGVFGAPLLGFGRWIPGLKWSIREEVGPDLSQPVFNENSVRAAAGLMLCLGLITLGSTIGITQVVIVDQPSQAKGRGLCVRLVWVKSYESHTDMMNKDLLVSLGRVVPPLFLWEFAARLLFGLVPLAPFGMAGSVITHTILQQEPIWVPAAPKRLAWIIGGSMAAVVTSLQSFAVRNEHHLSIYIICSSCLGAMYLEACCGFCLGCWMYGLAVRYKLYSPRERTWEDMPASVVGMVTQVSPV